MTDKNITEFAHRDISSDAQIKNLSLEFRKIQKEFKFDQNRSAHDFVRTEQEKVKELLKNENISVDGEKVTETENKNDEAIDLILTNGKIDLDKIICLHVFSIQQPENCELLKEGTAECDNNQTTKRNPLTRYSNILPSYLIENEENSIDCECWTREDSTFSISDRAIEIHLQVNSQIERMLNTVINVLKNLNTNKLKELSTRAHSAEEVTSTLVKSENQTFISSLLHSKFIQKNKNMRTETCSLMLGRTDLIQDISKFKKNIVFRLDVPGPLGYIYRDIAIVKGKNPPKVSKAKEQAESSFEKLVQIKKHVESNISLIPGYQLLQKGSSSGGIAVIDQNGTSISYITGESGGSKQKNYNDLTIFMQSPKVSDHQYVVEKMLELEGDKMIIAKPNTKTEEVCLKIAKRNMDATKKVALDNMNHEIIKEEILSRLSNEERMAIAKKAAKMKNSVINSQGEVKSIPIVKLLKGTVERHSLLKLVKNCSEKEKDVLFKPTTQGGMGIGELLMDDNELSLLSRVDAIKDAKNVAVVDKECSSRAPQKLKIGTDSPYGILKIEQEVSKKEIAKNCGNFIKRLTKK